MIDRVPGLGSRTTYTKQFIHDKLLDHKTTIHRYGEDMPEICNWKWDPGRARPRKGRAAWPGRLK